MKTEDIKKDPKIKMKVLNPNERVCERCGATQQLKLDVKAYYVAEGGISPKRIFCDKCYIEYSKEVYEAHQV